MTRGTIKDNKIVRAILFTVLALAMIFTVLSINATSASAATMDMTPKYNEQGNQIVGRIPENDGRNYSATGNPDLTAAKFAAGTAMAAAPQVAGAAALGTVAASTILAPAAIVFQMAGSL